MLIIETAKVFEPLLQPARFNSDHDHLRDRNALMGL